MSELKITVVGSAGTGKTTVASIIKEALSGHRIEAEVTDDHEVQYHGVEAAIRRKRIRALRTKQTRVIIETRRLERTSTTITKGAI